jgi:SSS family solute:Na+ symporter
LTSPAANPITFFIVGLYLAATLVVGFLSRRSSGTSAQFLHAGRTLPTAVTSIAFLAANCGALEIVGIVAASAKYGALALHFYWIGAIPAMVFLALFMMPIYAQSKALTVPEFLRLRYSDGTHILNAVSLAVMMGFVSGISLYAIATVMRVFLGWNFPETVALTTLVILGYVALGGLKATIYNEILQLGITIVGLIPLSYAVIRQFQGIAGLRSSLPESMQHVWTRMPLAHPATAPMDVVGVVAGLGFVLSFGYWCTDFMLIQRAMAAREIRGSIHTPLYAGAVKLVFPLLVVVPGLAASRVLPGGTASFDEALPAMMLHYYPPVLLGVGFAAILASLMSALAGNIAAISTIWTHDLYRAYLAKNRSDAHYVTVGRLATAGGTCFSIAAAYLAFRYSTLMDYLQLVFSLFNAPLFATLLLGMFTTWATPSAGFWGMAIGMIISISHNFAFRLHVIHYGSQMSANFYGAMLGFTSCLISTMLLSQVTKPKPAEQLENITYRTRVMEAVRAPLSSWVLALVLLGGCVWLNVYFR